MDAIADGLRTAGLRERLEQLEARQAELRREIAAGVALGSDAARQGTEVKSSFEAGIRHYLEMLGPWVGEPDGEEPGGKAMAILSTMVGAVVLSRAVNDERLSEQFLQTAAERVLTAAPADQARQEPRQSCTGR
ncbi:hypothetical protein [Roseococcus sp.]|uniref:hypothetical protein n=1 Tax=Roseococcus sp. TaxID=2109646 RepID=UPI003BA8C759